MISIRENVFETNSSSMHTLTVACKLKNKELYKKYLEKELERWKQPDGTYDIKIECTENSVDDNKRFDIRRYIPHFSVNDKMLYLLATIIQHYWNGVTQVPYDKSEFVTPWWKNHFSKQFQELKKKEGKNAKPKPSDEEIKEHEAKVKEEHEKYLQEMEDYNNKYGSFNAENFKGFVEKVHDVEESISSQIAMYLFGDWKEKNKVKVTFNYGGKDINVPEYTDNKEDYFSTGCYGNEEFYEAVCGHWGEVGEWICNPYSAVLAGSDEQSEEDSFDQEQEALRCISESFENGYNDYSDDIDELNRWIEEGYYSDDSEYLNAARKTIEKMKNAKKLNEGKVIYPLGG